MRMTRVIPALAIALLAAAVPAAAGTVTVWPTDFSPVDRSETRYGQTPQFIQLLSGAPPQRFQASLALPAGKTLKRLRFYCGTHVAGGGATLQATLMRAKLANPVVVEAVAFVACTSAYSDEPVLVPEETTSFFVAKTIPAGYRWWVETIANSLYNKIGAVQVVYQ